MPFTRRRFLERGLFGGALLSIAGGTALALRATRRDLATKTELLSPSEAAVLVAVAECVVPGTDASLLAERVDRALTFVCAEAQAEFKQLLLLLESALAGFLFDGRVTPFSALSLEERGEVLGRWRDSRWKVRRSGYQALRKCCLAARYMDSASWPAIGYPGPHRVVGLSYEDSKMGLKK